MALDNTRYDVPFRAPALPYPPVEYQAPHFEALNNILRLYFGQVDNALRNISKVVDVYDPSGDHDVSGTLEHEIVIMVNAAPATVNLPASPKDKSRVSVKRMDASVTVDGNGKLIDGAATSVLGTLYDATHLVYSSVVGKWVQFNG